MYRPTPIVMVLLLLAAACSDSAETTTTTAPPAPSTATTSTTSTTTTSTTTATSAITATTTMPEPSRFEGRPGTPVGELGSFTSTAEVTASLEDLAIVVETEGTYVGSAFQCQQTIDVGGLRIGMSVIATPDAVWIDSGQGFEESSLLDPEVDTVIAICAANPDFWTDFAPFPSLEGAPDSVNGIPAQRVELTELLGALSALGFEDISGVEFEGAVVWIAEEGGWLAQIDMTFTVEPEAAAALFGVPIDLSEPARLDFVVTVAAPDDPGLTVDVPSMVDG